MKKSEASDAAEGTTTMGHKRLASNGSSYANTTNSTLGAGVLGLPFAFAKTGWVFGPALLFIIGLFSFNGLHLITCVCAKTGFPSTIHNCSKPVHPLVPLFMDCLMACTLFGALCAYLIVIGDMMPQATDQLGMTGVWSERYVWVLIGFSLAAPFSFPTEIDFLKYTSAACILAIMYVTVVVLVFSLPGQDPCHLQGLDDDAPCIGSDVVLDGVVIKDVLKSIGIFVSGFCCQINSFPIISEVKTATVANMDKVFFFSIATAMSIYFIVASCGYSTYGGSIQSDLLLNYPIVPAITVARLMITFVVVFSYPLIVHPCRKSILSVVHFVLDRDEEGADAADGGETGENVKEQQSRMRYYATTVLLLALTLVVGLSVSDLGDVLSVTGATGGVTIMFIFPGGLYLWYFPYSSGRRKATIRVPLLDDDKVRRTIGALMGAVSDDADEEEEEEEEGGGNNKAEKGEFEVTIQADDESSQKDGEKVVNSIDSVEESASRAGSVVLYGLDATLVRDMPVPKSDPMIRALAWLQVITGCILLPVCITACFLQ